MNAREKIELRRAEIERGIAVLERQQESVTREINEARLRLAELDFAEKAIAEDAAPPPKERRPKRNVGEMVRAVLETTHTQPLDQILKRVNDGLSKADRVARRSVLGALDRDDSIELTALGYRLKSVEESARLKVGGGTELV